MATNENLIPIPGRLHSVASDEIVSGANEIYDDKLQDNQENLNTGFTNDIDTIYDTIGDNNEKGAIMEQLNTIDGRLDTIDGEIQALNHIPIEVVQLNPSTGEPDVSNPEGNILYRASNSDHTQYSDWMYKEDEQRWVMIFEQQTPSEQEKLVGYYTCSTAANQPEKLVGDTGYILPANGGAMKIKMTNANTANNATLKIGTETAKTLLYNGEAVSASNSWEKGEVISVYFDGTNYQASNTQGGGGTSGIKELKGITGAYILNNGDTLGQVVSIGDEAACYQYIKYPVNEGDVVMVSGKGASGALLWGIVGDNNTMIAKATGWTYENGLVIVMPEGARFITLNSMIAESEQYSTIDSHPKWFYAKKGSFGAQELFAQNYLYGDLRTLEIGQTYRENEAVKTSDKQLLRLTKGVKAMNVTDVIAVGDLKTYGTDADASTYKALKAVKVYNGTETEGLYAIGRPSLVTITVDSSSLAIEQDTDISITIGGVTNTITVTAAASETKDADIAALIAATFTNIDGWVLTDNGDGTLTLKCNTAGNNTISVSSNTGETGLSITSSAVNGNSTLNQYNNGSWENVTLDAFAGDYADIGVTDNTKMWQKLSIDALISLNIVQNTLAKTSKAENISYNNSQSGFASDNVQEALDETATRIGVNERTSFDYTDGYISPTGVITSSNAFHYTNPIFLFQGDTITVVTASYLFAPISLYENGVYTPIYAPMSGDTTTLKTYEYTATENCYVVASVKKQSQSSPSPSIDIDSDFIPINKAKGIQYDDSKSLLGSEDVQGAIDKVVTDIREETPYNVDDYPTQNTSLGTSVWQWDKNNQRGKHKVIPVTAGDVLHVTSQAVGADLGAYSGWLTSSYTPPTTGGGDIPYVTGTTRFVTNDSVITAPEGAAWLCLTVLDGGGYTIINTVAKVTKLKDIVNDTQDKFGDLSGNDIASSLERTTGKYIDLQGEEQEHQGYFITAPIYISAGTKLNVTYKGGLISVVSKVDGDTYIPILTDENHTGPTALTKHIVIEEGGFYVFCSSIIGGINAVIDLTVAKRIGVLERDTIGENVKYTYKGTGQYIDSNLNIINQSFEAPIYVITNEIEVKKGETITVKTKGGQIYIIVEYSEGEIVRGLLFSDSTVSTKYNEYSYTADKDMFILVGGVNDSTNPLTITIGQNFTDKINKLTQYHCGIYLYPFRAIVNKPVSIYRESVVSGLRPLYNYTVQTNFTQNDPTDDYSKYTIRFKATSEGTTPLTIVATDEFNNHISKTVNVVSRTMPESKLSNVNSMDVMFLGDSMIGWNGNLVGGEWRRMLATNDSETYVDPVTKAVQIPTYNVCPNKLNLVGEQMGTISGARYCYVNRIQQILTAKRPDDYNPNKGEARSLLTNPFYNINSSEPDTIGEDGFNRRVDFDWYFDNACGVGGYPKLFYIALGANDIYETWNWSFDGVKPTTELLLKVIKKIKSVCDERAGGDSGIKIKVFNHQTYPLYNMYGYEFPILQQRLVWNALYDSYYEAITNPDYGISEYTEFVDCGSKFDWRVGYTTEDISTNVRYDGNQDVYMEQTCHMNNVGAYNYADCLIDDFLVDSDFD